MAGISNPVDLPDKANMGVLLEVAATNGVRLNNANTALKTCQMFLTGTPYLKENRP